MMSEKIQNTDFVFDPIAVKYDRCNHLFSLWLDHLWRKRLVQSLQPNSGDKVLDLCCGTGDVVFSIAKHSPARDITGLDLSESMLHLTQEKQICLSGKKWMRGKQLNWMCGDAAVTPFESSTFDAITCAFGIRNITDRSKALAEMNRLLKPAGRLGVLEFSIPSSLPLRRLYLLYLTKLMPLIGTAFLGNRQPLLYLAASIQNWHNNVNFSQELTAAGFTNINARQLNGGIVTIWQAAKGS